ncbi:MAG: radical SAM protein, partial [Candidatus Kariarchaeaceae archaeon]
KSNNVIRGEKTFERAVDGIKNLLTHGFLPIVTAMQNWPLLQDGAMRDEFSNLLTNLGIEVPQQKLKILPPLRIGRESIRERPYTQLELFTPECFADYDYRNLQCSKCRIVSENGVYVCPILVNEDHAKMGTTLKEASRPYAMRDMACWTCRMEGMNCAND